MDVLRKELCVIKFRKMHTKSEKILFCRFLACLGSILGPFSDTENYF